MKRFFVLIVFVALLVLFFFGYNIFLVDRSLQNMRFVLEQVSWAQDINDMSKVGVLLDDMLLDEVSSMSADSSRLAGIEFMKDIAGKGFVKKQVSDAQFLLKQIINEKEKERSPLLRIADRINNKVLELLRFLAKGKAARPGVFKPAEGVDASLIEAAKRYESNWQFKEAIEAYRNFMEKYPAYPQLVLVKLKIGDAYFKSADYPEAGRMYREVLRQFPNSDEAKIAEAMLKKIKERMKKQRESDKVQNEIDMLFGAGPLAGDYKELSLADSQLEKLDAETKESILSILGGRKAAGKPAASPEEELIDRAKQLEDEWRLEEAIALYEEFISKYPKVNIIPLAKLMLAGACLKSMQYDKALSSYAKLIEDYPSSEEAGLAKRLAERTRQMIAIYKKRQVLMEKVSKSKNIQELAQGYYKLGIANTYLFDMARAEKAFKNVMELVPGTELAKKAQFNLGWTYKFSGKYNDASATFSRFIAEYPNDKLAQDAKYQLANSYYKAGKFEEAARNYAELGKAFPGSQLASLAQFQAGYTLLYDLHKPLEAAEAFGELKKKYQNSAFADYVDTGVVSVIDRSYRYYGFLSLRHDKLEEAGQSFINAIAVNPDDAWSHSGLGIIYALTKRYDEAIKLASEGVGLVSDSFTHAALGFAYYKKGEYQKAIAEYRRSSEYEADYFIVRYNLGRTYIAVERYDAAIKELKEAIKLQPNKAYAHNDLGYAYWHNGQVASAENEFKEALMHDSRFTEASYNLGLVYEASGKYQKAATYFRDVLSETPDYEPAKQHLEYAEAQLQTKK